MKATTASRIRLGLSFTLAVFMVGLFLAGELQGQARQGPAVGLDEHLLSEQRFWIDQTTKKAIRPTSDPEVWAVLTSLDEKDWTAFAPIRVLFSLEVLPPTGAMTDALEKANFRLVDRQMVVGSIGGDQAQPRYVTALVMQFERPYTDLEGTPIRHFVPVLVSINLEEAKDFARDMARIYNGLPPGGP